MIKSCPDCCQSLRRELRGWDHQAYRLASCSMARFVGGDADRAQEFEL
jgi:hypothetical protein